MILTFITNAAAIYEHAGFRLLSDPWLTEPAFGSWVHDPPLKTKPEDVLDVDALYISHLHQDHCDPETLKHFRRDIPIVCLKDRFTPRHLERMGFTDICALPDGVSMSLMDTPGDFDVRILGPFAKHPHFECEIGNVIDSALLIEAGGVRVLNTNDNTPTVEKARWLRETYGPFDVVQLNFNNAGPFPACFPQLDRKVEAAHCIQRNLLHMAALARELDAKWTMPFAGAYRLSYGREHLNEFLGTTSAEHACEHLAAAGIKPLLLKEGECLDLSQEP